MASQEFCESLMTQVAECDSFLCAKDALMQDDASKECAVNGLLLLMEASKHADAVQEQEKEPTKLWNPFKLAKSVYNVGKALAKR